MPQLTSYALHFRGGLHIGTRWRDAGRSGSFDSIRYAFFSIIAKLDAGGRRYRKICCTILQNPSRCAVPADLRIPLCGRTALLSNAAGFIRLFEAVSLEKRSKSLKKIRYFSEGLLQRALKGEKLDSWLFPEDEKDTHSKGLALQGGALWLLPDEIGKLPESFRKAESVLPMLNVWKEARTPRVTIERISNASNIYQAGRVQFAEGCGLWFGVDWCKPDETFAEGVAYKSAFQQALEVLQGNGLGGERSSGYGAFNSKPMSTTFFYDEPKSDGMAYLLSRYIPRK